MKQRMTKGKNPGPAAAPAVLAVCLLAAAGLMLHAAAPAQAGDGALVIPLSQISGTAAFFPVEVDGTAMEVIAVRDSAGKVRTAFNTCQICYGSGRGYYVQQGSVLVCQNCGNRFTIDHIEVESGGCNPWPIFDSDKTVTDTEIIISYDFLKEASRLFANWKTSY